MRYKATQIWKSRRRTNSFHFGDDSIAPSTDLAKG